MDFFTTLKEHSYVHVPISIELSGIRNAVKAFFQFLNEPELIKSYNYNNMCENNVTF